MARRGFYAEAQVALGTDIVDEAARRCNLIAEKYPQAQFLPASSCSRTKAWSPPRWLHNHNVLNSSRLYQNGRAMLILPIRVKGSEGAKESHLFLSDTG